LGYQRATDPWAGDCGPRRKESLRQKPAEIEEDSSETPKKKKKSFSQFD
jgi:hypothetical protein